MKKKNIGICHLCLQEKELTYEHYPPKSAFNKNTSFYSISHHEYMEDFKEFHLKGKIKSKINQGGLGDYCLCKECNNFLGINYVKDYVKFSKICYSILQQEQKFKAIGFTLKRNEVDLKNFIKQITAIFICCNDLRFTEIYPELLEFVKDKGSQSLSEKFRFYLYLNNEEQLRNGAHHFTNLYGEICEFTFPPFGLVLNISNPNTLSGMAEITSFKEYDLLPFVEFKFILNKYPAYTPFPLDFRTKDEIDNSFGF